MINKYLALIVGLTCVAKGFSGLTRLPATRSVRKVTAVSVRKQRRFDKDVCK